MIILPAIDIINDKPVRLFKGDFATAEQVAEDVLQTAKDFEACGASWVHMVDLDGSLQKKPVNTQAFLTVARNTSLRVEVGGGIRTLKDIAYYAENGISRVILGSVALKNPALVKEAVAEFGSRIAVGIDAKNEYAATEGWTENSNIHYIELAKRMEAIGAQTIIYTDISRDGTLKGPNIAQLVRLNEAVSCDIIASGGVTDINDIVQLGESGLYGAICGKSIYKGTLDLKEAIERSRA